MSRKGNCYDNAVAESFLGSLKIEELYKNKYFNILAARILPNAKKIKYDCTKFWGRAMERNAQKQLN